MSILNFYQYDNYYDYDDFSLGFFLVPPQHLVPYAQHVTRVVGVAALQTASMCPKVWNTSCWYILWLCCFWLFSPRQRLRYLSQHLKQTKLSRQAF